MANTFKKKDGSTVVKGKDGKILSNLPAAHKQPKSAPILPQKPAVEAELGLTPYEIRQQQYAYESQMKAEAYEALKPSTDYLETKYPGTHYLTVDDNNNPVSVESIKGEVVAILDKKEDAPVFEAFASHKQGLDFVMEKAWLYPGRTPTAAGASKAVFLYFKCDEDPECGYRSTRYGMGPRHYFSQYCRSGKRPHCTCDTCF